MIDKATYRRIYSTGYKHGLELAIGKLRAWAASRNYIDIGDPADWERVIRPAEGRYTPEEGLPPSTKE